MLELTNLHASYGKTPILRGVDVDDGEIVGIMGKNGVGKTTLVKAVMGLLEVLFEDGELTGRRWSVVRTRKVE